MDILTPLHDLWDFLKANGFVSAVVSGFVGLFFAHLQRKFFCKRDDQRPFRRQETEARSKTRETGDHQSGPKIQAHEQIMRQPPSKKSATAGPHRFTGFEQMVLVLFLTVAIFLWTPVYWVLAANVFRFMPEALAALASGMVATLLWGCMLAAILRSVEIPFALTLIALPFSGIVGSLVPYVSKLTGLGTFLSCVLGLGAFLILLWSLLYGLVLLHRLLGKRSEFPQGEGLFGAAIGSLGATGAEVRWRAPAMISAAAVGGALGVIIGSFIGASPTGSVRADLVATNFVYGLVMGASLPVIVYYLRYFTRNL